MSGGSFASLFVRAWHLRAVSLSPGPLADLARAVAEASDAYGKAFFSIAEIALIAAVSIDVATRWLFRMERLGLISECTPALDPAEIGAYRLDPPPREFVTPFCDPKPDGPVRHVDPPSEVPEYRRGLPKTFNDRLAGSGLPVPEPDESAGQSRASKKSPGTEQPSLAAKLEELRRAYEQEHLEPEPPASFWSVLSPELRALCRGTVGDTPEEQ
jgi:hypothetical protein